jgi:hypothetical protein
MAAPPETPMAEQQSESHNGDGVTDGPEGPTASPFADEARKLMAAVQEWAQRTMPEPPSGHGGPECQWCPLCQFASILRGEHPELTEWVAEAGTALATAFRALVETSGAKAGPSGDDGKKSRPRPAPRVQRIRLDDVDDES